MSGKVEEDEASASPDTKHLPKLVAFDLDATLWYPEMYELYGAPFKRDSSGSVTDRSGEEVFLYDEVRDLLTELHTDERWSGTAVAYASRTSYPEWAYEVMKLMKVNKEASMHDVQDHSEVYPGDKKQHFANFSKASGVSFEDMIFFDNERRNCTSVASLGVTCVHTPHGMTRKAWEKGLKAFAASKSSSTAGGGKSSGSRKKKSRGRR